ncbi:MAG: ABC transporter permease, partial [Thermodesulfobacteriota bacterium]
MTARNKGAEEERPVGLGRRRWRRFRRNRRGLYSLIIFSFVFILSLLAEGISNDVPLLVIHDGKPYFPLLVAYPETTFGGDFETETDYLDPYIIELLSQDGNRVYFPLNRHSYQSINFNIDGPV